MIIKDKGDDFELKVIVEKFKRVLVNVKVDGKYMLDENGKKIKEEVEKYYGDILVPTTFRKEGIVIYGETPNHRYRVQKTKSTIYDQYSNKFYVVKHTTDEIEKAKSLRSIVGFQLGKNQ